MRRIAHIFVQPHLDDVALSCGGTVALCVEKKEEPVIVTVFCATPSPGTPISDFAATLHRAWGGNVEEVWAMRQEEDARAARVLGAASIRLAFEDAIYRGGRYLSSAALRGPPADGDADVAARVEGELIALWRGTRSARVYLPLAVGGHVDHRICHAAGAALERAGASVSYYEDVPYVTVSGALDAHMTSFGESLVPVVVDVTSTFARRLEAIEAYASQLPRLFRMDGPFPGPHRARIEAWARTVSPSNGLAERFWMRRRTFG
jgi:LmbE family N-acetylglucosaminyl deacetylase